jgi:ProP effector
MQSEYSTIIETLADLFPAVFVAERWRNHKPLARGIHLDLVARGVLTTEETKVLRYYVRRRMYLAALSAGGDRFDLDGQPSGVVTDEEAATAAKAVEAIDKANAAKAAAVRQAVRSLRRNVAPRVWKVFPDKPEPAPEPAPQCLSLAGLKAAAQARAAANAGGAQ